MAYCESCGAYIPDGQTGCLACGFDSDAKAREEKKKAAAAAGAAAAAKKKDDDLREILEKHRQQQQEQNRQWAEQEKARREQQANNREWAEKEYARRQAEKERQAQQYVNQSSTSYRTDSTTGAASQGNKALSCLSYLSVFFALPYFLTPEDKYARFHARQGMKLFFFGIAADILGGMTGLGWIVSLARLFFMAKGISNAYNGKMEPLPYIGTLGDNK